MDCENIEAFRYLLGRNGIDFCSLCTETNITTIAVAALTKVLVQNCCIDFFRELFAHPSFDIVSSFEYNEYAVSPLHFAIGFLDEDVFPDPVPLPTWKANFQFLLSVGADPYMEVEGFDAIEFAKQMLRKNPESQELKDAVEILEDWVAIK